ncbi:hypothetical protein [Mammaliicoccus sciuri]|uniref:hypothetical protein n=1 Tax=Mammaliicoccus sciuri TaxID=1296 RepID=UPI002B258829|nr:hypothetical protein [Mammaliicoccus sciuri]WQK75197.1 hypothetical protein P3U33_05565 [Mammaliicoccus sciuri]
MKLKKFLETYKIVEERKIIKSTEILFDELSDEDTILFDTMFEKGQYETLEEYSIDERTLYYVYLDDEEIKSDLTYEQLEQFIENL